MGVFDHRLFSTVRRSHPVVVITSTAMSAFGRFLKSPTGPKTVHFWGPIANWGFVIAGLVDLEKPAEKVSGPMTTALCFYSLLFMRFAWRVQPRNYLLLACHTSNEAVQGYHLFRKVKYEYVVVVFSAMLRDLDI